MCSMAKYNKAQQDLNAPHPVRPRAISNHGLFGLGFVNDHMMIDDRWTLNSLNDQFKGVNDILERRITFKRLEAIADNQAKQRHYRALRRQCRDGRTKLLLLLQGENQKILRNFLTNHRDLQRLYQRMPLHMVVDNINQRTFVMRKECDRLRFRRNQLEKEYHMKLLCKAELENRIKYENEFVLEAEVKARNVRKEIENSNVRLKAVKTINVTYKKIIQILQHDQIFYEPIWTSLSQDIDDQAAFIKYILYLGTPAIKSFKVLSKEFHVMEDKARKTRASDNSNFGGIGLKDRPISIISIAKDKQSVIADDTVQRYVRETGSMQFLKMELEYIENTIKHLKTATLCSSSREIFLRTRLQMENNKTLRKAIEKEIMAYDALVIKDKRASKMEAVLINNLSEEEIRRQERIQQLTEALALEDEFEAKTIQYNKNRADVYVLIRISLWNMFEMLRHIGKPTRLFNINYPNSYLKLPLLRFEMLKMRACPPDTFEENLIDIMPAMRRKVHKLMKAYGAELPKEQLRENRDEYHEVFLEHMELYDENEEAQAQAEADAQQQPKQDEEELMQENKISHNVPNRKQIKALSAKIVEDNSKKEEET